MHKSIAKAFFEVNFAIRYFKNPIINYKLLFVIPIARMFVKHKFQEIISFRLNLKTIKSQNLCEHKVIN